MVDNNGQLHRQERIDLAAAFRWTARLGMHEAIGNHFTLAVNDEGSEFLVNPWGKHFSRIKASDLLRVDREGNVLEGDGVVERSAVCIHAPIHYRLSHARCVLHCHPAHVNAMVAVGERIQPIHQSSARFYDQVAYDDDFGGLAFADEEGERICGKLSNKCVLMMANHGVTVVGNSVAEAFDRLYFIEKVCETQVLALSTGRPLKLMSEEVAKRTAEQWAGHNDVNREVDHFNALKGILDEEEPDYAH